MADEHTDEQRKQAFRVVERQNDLQDFIGEASKETAKQSRGCPRCGERDWDARSTQYYLLYCCNKCGHKWEALVAPNTTGGAALPQDPVEKALESMPRYRDPRKQRRLPDE